MDAYLLGLRAPLFDGGTGETVRYVPRIAGAPVDGLRVVRASPEADALFDGSRGEMGRARRQVRFEVRFGTLPRPPQRDDAIEASDGVWRVIQCDPRPDIGAWYVNVEAARNG